MPYQRNFAEIIVPGGGLSAKKLSGAVSERWQSGRMRVFAKDVSGQKLDRGFESRPLRLVKKVEKKVPCFQGFLKSESSFTSVTLLKLC